MSFLVCMRCKKKVSAKECPICLDNGDVVKLCNECYPAHMRSMHDKVVGAARKETDEEILQKAILERFK